MSELGHVSGELSHVATPRGGWRSPQERNGGVKQDGQGVVGLVAISRSNRRRDSKESREAARLHVGKFLEGSSQRFASHVDTGHDLHARHAAHRGRARQATTQIVTSGIFGGPQCRQGHDGGSYRERGKNGTMLSSQQGEVHRQ